MSQTIEVESRKRDDWLDVTRQVREIVARARVKDGIALVFVPHTTAGITLQENADPPLKADITAALGRIFPWEGNYGHGEDNAAAHLKTVLMGSSVQVPISAGQLSLGRWQSIYLVDFDGPRRRQVIVKTLGT